MSANLLWAGRTMCGLVIAGAGAFGIYQSMTLASWDGWMLFKIIPVVLLFIVSLLAIDSGIGLVQSRPEAVKLVFAERQQGAPNWLFLLVPGYNGNGNVLVDTLAPALEPYGDVVSFEAPSRGFSEDQIIEALYQLIIERRPDQLVVEGESLGGMILAEMLRQHPDLHFNRVVFSATPDRVGDVLVGGSWLKLANVLYGGPILTSILRWKQRRDVKHAPQPEPPANPSVVKLAHAESINRLTAPVALGQVRVMANFAPPAPGEFAGRADKVIYLRAPGPADAFIKTAVALLAWRAAFGDDVVTDASVASWAPGLHTPTPERPGPLIGALIGP